MRRYHFNLILQEVSRGDIVCADEELWEVCYDKEDACYYLHSGRYMEHFSCFYDEELEVHGNMIDNPELMEEQENDI